MSQLAGKPVRLQFMRWDEHGWDNYGPAQMMDIRGGVDANGNIVATEFTHFAIPCYGDRSRAAGAGRRRPARSGSTCIDATQQRRAVQHPEPAGDRQELPLENQLLQESFLRAPNAPQSVFAVRAADRRARVRGEDGPGRVPAPEHREQRRRARTACRSRGPLEERADGGRQGRELAAEGRGVEPRQPATSSPAAASRSAASPDTMAASSPTSTVNKKTGKITRDAPLRRAGHRPDRLPRRGREQGGGQHDAGREPCALRAGRVRQERRHEPRLGHLPDDPLQGLAEDHVHGRPADGHPGSRHGTVATSVLATGSGEPPTAPVAAAVANAFFDATGVRIRRRR